MSAKRFQKCAAAAARRHVSCVAETGAFGAAGTIRGGRLLRARLCQLALIAVVAGIMLGGCGAASHSPLHSRSDSQVTSRRAVTELYAAVSLVGERGYSDALKWFVRLKEVFDEAGDASRAGECLFWQGYCLEKLHKKSAAARAYRLVLDRYGQTPAARQSARRLVDMES